mgnify:FL=1
MNIKAILVTALALLFLGCGPEKDILQDWAGSYVVLDSQGYADRGCRISHEGRQRELVLWHYSAAGSVVEERHSIQDFELIDQYSRNYGTPWPTWIYRYRSGGTGGNAGPEFLIYEYFSGDLEARLRPAGADGTRTLERVEEIPAVLKLRERDLPDDLVGLRELDGRHFWIEGEVLRAERQERGGRLSPASSDIFDAGFIDQLELEPRDVGAWRVYPVLRSPVLPAERAGETPLPAAGSRMDGLVRLMEIREKARSDGRGVVLSYRYQPEG